MDIVQVDPRVFGRVTYPVGRVSDTNRKAIAQSIFNHVCRVAGVHVPEFVLRVSRSHILSSGRNQGGWRITVTLGSNPQDWYSVIVHEVTHSVVGVRNHHNAKFYEAFFRLVKSCGYDLQYSINRERGYKPRNSAKAARGHR